MEDVERKSTISGKIMTSAKEFYDRSLPNQIMAVNEQIQASIAAGDRDIMLPFITFPEVRKMMEALGYVHSFYNCFCR